MLRVGTQVIVELKNDLAIQGTLHSVDQYLSVKLTNVKVVNESKYPHMVGAQRMRAAQTIAETQLSLQAEALVQRVRAYAA